jgi:hypothetical protein
MLTLGVKSGGAEKILTLYAIGEGIIKPKKI